MDRIQNNANQNPKRIRAKRSKRKGNKGMAIKIREEYFPFLVLNGWSKSGLLIWVDYGKFFKVMLKEDYENRNRMHLRV